MVVCTVVLVEIFVNGWELSVHLLLPGYYKEVNAKMHENKYIDRYMTDVVFKSNVGLYRSLVINLIYVVVNAVTAYIHQTYWFGIFVAYYAVIAMYTFYITTTAIIDMVKSRKYKSPILSITKVIKMTSVLFSMLFLETAMFAQFGADTSLEIKRLLTVDLK